MAQRLLLVKLLCAGVNANDVCNSEGYVRAHSRGVCPVVSLSSKLLNIDETGKDGQSIENAWNMK